MEIYLQCANMLEGVSFSPFTLPDALNNQGVVCDYMLPWETLS